MNILGIDLSLNGTGLAILTDDERFVVPMLAEYYTTRQGRSLGRGESYYGWLLSPMPTGMLDRWKAIEGAIVACAENCHQVLIEGYSFGSNMAYVRSGAELGGIVRYALRKMGHMPIEVPPKTLKKFLTNSGNADKNQVLKEVYKRYHVDLPDDNMADAFGLAKFGQALSSTDELPAFQVEIIDGFKKPKVKPARKSKRAPQLEL